MRGDQSSYGYDDDDSRHDRQANPPIVKCRIWQQRKPQGGLNLIESSAKKNF